MPAVLSVAIADELINERQLVRRRLIDAGYEVACEESDIPALAAHLAGGDREAAPDLSLLTFPADAGEPAATLRTLGIAEGPVVAIVDHADQITPAMRQLPGLMGILIRPVAASAISAVVEIALRQLARLADVQRRLDDAEKALAERKLIERAKGLVMLQAKVSEDEAFSRMRQAARTSRKSIAAIAQDILVTHQLVTGAAG